MKGDNKSKAGATKADSKLGVQKGGKGAANKLKRPPTAFFVFMDDFRQDYKAKHPNNKLVSAVAKAGGVKWKSLSEDEKAPFLQKAAKLKSDYEKVKNAQDNEEEIPDAGSDKSKSDSNGVEEDED